MSATITAIAIIPAAFFPKTGQDAYRSLAVVTIGGLLTGTFLSLFDVPIMHTFTDDVVRWFNKIFLNRDWSWPVQAAEPAQPGSSGPTPPPAGPPTPAGPPPAAAPAGDSA